MVGQRSDRGSPFTTALKIAEINKRRGGKLGVPSYDQPVEALILNHCRLLRLILGQNG